MITPMTTRTMSPEKKKATGIAHDKAGISGIQKKSVIVMRWFLLETLQISRFNQCSNQHEWQDWTIIVLE